MYGDAADERIDCVDVQLARHTHTHTPMTTTIPDNDDEERKRSPTPLIDRARRAPDRTSQRTRDGARTRDTNQRDALEHCGALQHAPRRSTPPTDAGGAPTRTLTRFVSLLMRTSAATDVSARDRRHAAPADRPWQPPTDTAARNKKHKQTP